MKVIAWFSCGTTSAVACKLALQKYGKENVDIYYIGIKSAHDDNARFIKDCEKWYQKEIKTAKSKKYEDQFEVIEDTGYVNGAGGARCTLELKKEVRFELQRKSNYNAQIFGFEFSLKEINRSIRFTEQYPEVNAEYPLIEQCITKPQCAEILLMNGIQLPTMYLLGYNNNNCIGCVKGKKGYWNKIRIDFPEVFDKMAKAERIAGHSCIKVDIRQPDGTLKGKPVFLDTLNPNQGRKLKPVVPDCGSLCEIKFTDIISDKAKEIYKAGKSKSLTPQVE
ncbi:MAG TPA: hypothetical protein VN922_14485 [Bacteroidia bacterium]|nr:hypothetical protein [Bacteroidia bacterium]